MSEMQIEDRKKNRVRKKKMKKRVKLISGIIIGLLFLTVAGISIHSMLMDETYRTEEEFRDYVDSYFSVTDNQRAYTALGEEEIISYDKPLSIAIKYPVTGYDKANEAITSYVTEMQDSFYEKYADNKRRDKTVRMMNYEVFYPQNNVLSVVFMWEDHRRDRFDMVKSGEGFHTINFSTETGEPLDRLTLFNAGYKYFFEDYLNDYLTETYGDKLKDDYMSYIEATDENLNDYVFTDGGIKFYFHKGTILPKSEGIISVQVGYEEMEKIIRPEDDERVIDPEKPMVALTYDDGPYPDVSNRILNCLTEYGAVATFFEVGENVEKYPEVVEREADLGMEIGNHTWGHPNLVTLDRDDVHNQVEWTNEELVDACGQSATVFRPPYGSTDDETNEIIDMPVILWSVDTLDWKSRDAESIIEVVEEAEGHKMDDDSDSDEDGEDEYGLDGDVILMHSLYESTAEATEAIVPWLIDRGYQLVTVSELIEYRYDEDPEDGKLYGYSYFN